MIVENVVELVGKTPILKLEDHGNNIYVKLEKFNPAGSIKDRAVLNMLKKMEEKRLLNKGDILVEATSGNTGIALAMLGKVMGYEVIIVMPESMSEERKQLVKAYGATLILTSKSEGMLGSINKAKALMDEHHKYKSIKQFENKANNEAHYLYTCQEIIKDIPDLNIFVAGIGTGGTISGVGKGLKEYNKDILVYGVEPEASPLINKAKFGPHKIQGIGANFIPENVERQYLDDVLMASDEDAFAFSRKFALQTGILVGISSGANLAAAYNLSLKNKGKNLKIVTVAPDGGERYLSSGLYD